MSSEASLDALKKELEEIRKKIELLEEVNRSLKEENQNLSRQAEELKQLIANDPVTGLPIRREFYRSMKVLIERLGKSRSKIKAGICILRLDRNYERIKNTRDRNNILIFKTAARIKELIGENIFQSDRLDEFLIILKGIYDIDDILPLAREIISRVSQPHEPPAEDVSFGCYLGVAVYPDHGRTRSDLLGNANIALSECSNKRVPLTLYSDSIGSRFREMLRIEKDLAYAIGEGFTDFEIYYQPFIDSAMQIRGSEALIRWKHPELGTIPPDRFIPIAEESGDIRFLGQWILYHACKQLKEWHRMGFPDIYVSVNLSPSQFKQRDLVERIAGVLDAVDMDGSFLKLELTEGTIMEDPEDAIIKMSELRKQGIRISIDDFGTGYSSLSYLKRFPIDTLKIDKSFIDDVLTNISNQEIVKAIISMARNMRIESLAEGVENEDQLFFLLEEGCKNIQGYHFAKPLSAKEFTVFIQEWVKTHPQDKCSRPVSLEEAFEEP